METKKKIRYILQSEGVEVMRCEIIQEIANFIGCSKAYIHVQLGKGSTGTFKYKKREYTIIDRLDF